MLKNPSKYQMGAGNWVIQSTGNATMEAVAGSGKTSTIVWLLNLLPPQANVVFLAFNKSIAEELRTRDEVRTNPNVNVLTFHSLGWRAWAKYVGQKKLYMPTGTSKMWRIMFKMKDDGMIEPEEVRMYGAFVNRVASLMKNAGAKSDDLEEMQRLIDHHSVILESRDGDPERAKALTRRAMIISCEIADHEIDFDDMLYMPYIKNAAFPKYDWVFVDELQDTNTVQQYIIPRLMAPKSRFMGVGDRHQAIYGFRGADAKAMDNISDTFNATHLPLTISYRCPKAVVAHAKNYVQHIEPWDKAQKGEVILESPRDYDGSMFTKSDAVLCRFNAPLVKMFYWLLKQGIGSKIIGRDVGANLISLVKKMDAHSLAELKDNLVDYFEEEEARLRKKGQHEAVANLKDKHDCLGYIIDSMKTSASPNDVISAIEGMFADRANGLLTLSSIHRAKGKEWDTVYILNAEMMPCKWAKTEWELEQENNLHYVAITRSKNKLVYISDSYRKENQ